MYISYRIKQTMWILLRLKKNQRLIVFPVSGLISNRWTCIWGGLSKLDPYCWAVLMVKTIVTCSVTPVWPALIMPSTMWMLWIRNRTTRVPFLLEFFSEWSLLSWNRWALLPPNRVEIVMSFELHVVLLQRQTCFRHTQPTVSPPFEDSSVAFYDIYYVLKISTDF